jgi:hypothetical protein
MSHAIDEMIFFRFEEDFVEAEIRCIPMIVRFKLDACGIKLKLAEWSKMTPSQRAQLASAPCDTPKEVSRYQEHLSMMIRVQAGSTPTFIPVPENPPWSRKDDIPYTVLEKSKELECLISLSQWQHLTDLQRFALLKLSYAGHENKNFPKALREFGLLRDQNLNPG